MNQLPTPFRPTPAAQPPEPSRLPLKILLTGGAGFIGSHLLERLLARGDEVVVIDDFNDYYDPAIKRRNLPKTGFRLYERDIRASAEIVLSEKPDVLVHLAARAGVRPSQSQPLLYDSVNVRGTLGLLEACRKVPSCRFIFASSSSVYGNALVVPFREDCIDIHPISLYGVTKLIGEHYVRLFSRLYGLHATCLRFFTAYGPRQRPDMAIHAFTAAIFRGQEIPMFGDGTTERDYTFVTDIVQGLLGAIDHDETFGVYNLGESRTIELRRLIDLIGQHVGRVPRIRTMPEQPGDVTRTCASIDLARNHLGYDPKVAIEDGVREFVAWYKAGMAVSAAAR